jgi:hypothetical protein
MNFLQHCWGLALLIYIILGPIPCSLILALPSSYRLENLTITRIPLVIFTSWSTLQICIGLLAGTVGQFSLNLILLWESILFVFGIAILCLHKNTIFSDAKKYLNQHEKLSKFELLILGTLLFTTCVLLEQLTTHPIIDYDSLWYHLPTMARWYQEGIFIRLPEFMSSGTLINDQITYYPYNWEILCTLFFMPFQEDFLISLPNLLAWLALGLAIYYFAINLNIDRFYGIAFASIVLMIPLIMQNINSLHIDLPFATFFMISLCFAITYYKTHFTEDLVIFVSSLCMLLGVKASAIAYISIPILILLVLESRRLLFYKKSTIYSSHNHILRNNIESSKEINLKKARLLISFLIFIGSLYMGGFWYFKNLIDKGNPLGNIKIQIANIVLFSGSLDLKELDPTSLIYLFKINNFNHWMIFIIQSLVRLQIPFIAMMLLVFIIPFAILKKRELVRFKLIFSSLALLLSTGYLYCKSPYTGSNLPNGPITSHVGQQLRYAISFLALLGVNAAIVATILQFPRNPLLIIVLISGIAGILSITVIETMQISSAFQGKMGWASKVLDDIRVDPSGSVRYIFSILGNEIITGVIYIFLYIIFICFMFWCFNRIAKGIPVFPSYDTFSQHSKKALIVFILVITLASYAARDKRDIKRQEVYGNIYQYIATNLKPAEAVGYLYSQRSYLLYGKNWQQRVLYAPPQSKDLAKWSQDLKDKHISAVAIGPLEEQLGWRDKPEIPWLQNPQGSFTKVFGQDPEKGYTIYRHK